MCRDESRRERQLSSHIRSGLLVGRSLTRRSALRPGIRLRVHSAIPVAFRLSSIVADSRGLRPLPPP